MTQRCLWFVLTITIGAQLLCADDNNRSERPNILIISIDDLNDWVGCLGGHPQAKTPNIDRLAKRGTLFANAHCQAPICTPSRASLVSGMYPASTGLYFLNPGLEASPVTKGRRTLLEHFRANGYRTMGAGKFHHKNEAKYFQEYGGGMGGFGPLPTKKISYPTGLKLWDWGPHPDDDAKMPDKKVADWVIEKLNSEHEQPFVLVAGFWRPHVPLYAPPKWFKPFPLDKIKLPVVIKDDRNDLSEYAKRLTVGHPAPAHEWFLKNNAWKGAVQAYLASVAFADHCAGRVLNALEKSKHANNTVVVLLSDHGWHLGEKERWAKRSLWHDSTHVPLILAGPGIESDQVSQRPVGLIDVFPTLCELTDVTAPSDLEGRSLKPLIDQPDKQWDYPAITTFAPGNHSLRTTHWHYIRYGDGSEELYDHRVDPHEWKNLAPRSGESTFISIATVIDKFRTQLPKRNHMPIIGDWKNWEIEAWREAQKLPKIDK